MMRGFVRKNRSCRPAAVRVGGEEFCLVLGPWRRAEQRHIRSGGSPTETGGSAVGRGSTSFWERLRCVLGRYPIQADPGNS
jgi:hypothetical protein